MTAPGLCWVDGCDECAVPGRSLCSAHARLRTGAERIGVPLQTAVLAARGDERAAPWVRRALDAPPPRSRTRRTFGRGGPR